MGYTFDGHGYEKRGKLALLKAQMSRTGWRPKAIICFNGDFRVFVLQVISIREASEDHLLLGG